jgi:NADH-quinone oxidoreductase subunit A
MVETVSLPYLPILILFVFALFLGGGALVLTHLCGPRLPSPAKNKPFECGFDPVGDARQRISVRYYVVAILFLLFDIEVVFLYPWAVIYRKLIGPGAFILIEMGIFIGLLLLGYVYALRKGAFEWD